jgi:hypothetical protein
LGGGFAALRCIAELHSPNRWEALTRGTDPTPCRLQVGAEVWTFFMNRTESPLNPSQRIR